MKNIENNLKQIVKDLDGKMSVFGSVYDKILNLIDKSKNILSCDLISEYSFSFSGKKSGSGILKKFNIKKLKKVYEKDSINQVIINLDEFDKYKKTLIRDSAYICKGNIIIFSENKEYDIDTIISRYNRYKCFSSYHECSDGFIIVIDASASISHKYLDKFYFIKDTFYDVIETISNLL